MIFHAFSILAVIWNMKKTLQVASFIVSKNTRDKLKKNN